jgi:hypothetical protein
MAGRDSRCSFGEREQLSGPHLAADYASAFASFALVWEAQVAAAVDSYRDLQDSFKRPERLQQAHFLRDLFGPLPFRTLSVDPSWLTPAVVGQASFIYEEQRFDRLPDLAIILEARGCTNAEILSHCRGPGPHVRGCFVIDLLLGKA